MGMEAWAINFVAGDPEGYLLAIMGCMAIGAILGVIKTQSIMPLRRVPYFVNAALITLAASSPNFLSLSAIHAIQNGYFALLLAASLLIPGLCGFFLTRIAIARSRDAYDTGRWAFLAFVPLLNLILLFKRSSDLNSQKPAETSRLLSGPTGVATGLVLLLVTVMSNAMIEPSLNNTQSASTASSNTSTGNDPGTVNETDIADYLEEVAAISNENLPQRIDEITVINRLEASETTLTRFYEIEQPEFNPGSDFENQVRRGICENEQLRQMLSAGVTIVERYTPQSGASTDIPVVSSDCSGS